MYSLLGKIATYVNRIMILDSIHTYSDPLDLVHYHEWHNLYKDIAQHEIENCAGHEDTCGEFAG